MEAWESLSSIVITICYLFFEEVTDFSFNLRWAELDKFFALCPTIYSIFPWNTRRIWEDVSLVAPTSYR